MTDLVKKLHDDLLDSNMRLSNCLLTAYSIASQLDLEEWIIWLNKEMHGYNLPEDEVPSYRIIGNSRLIASIGARRCGDLSHEVLQPLRQFIFWQGVCQLEQCNEHKVLVCPIDDNSIVDLVKQLIGVSLLPVTLRREASVDQINQVLFCVKHELQKWVLKMLKNNITLTDMTATISEKENAKNNNDIAKPSITYNIASVQNLNSNIGNVDINTENMIQNLQTNNQSINPIQNIQMGDKAEMLEQVIKSLESFQKEANQNSNEQLNSIIEKLRIEKDDTVLGTSLTIAKKIVEKVIIEGATGKLKEIGTNVLSKILQLAPYLPTLIS